MENQEMLSLILHELKDLKSSQEKMEQDTRYALNNLKDGQEKLEQGIRYTRILVEQQAHDIRLIAEQHTDVTAKLEPVKEIEPLKSRVSTLEHVVRTHSDEFELLKKAE